MSSEPTNNPAPTHDERIDRRTELLRAAADGELTAADAAALDAHLRAHPEDRAVIDFERRLRREIAGAAEGHATDDLRARIEAMRSADEPIPVRPRRTRQAWLALAACLALALGAVYILAPRPAPHPAPGQVVAGAHRASLVSFMRSQHEDCETFAEILAQKFPVVLERAPEALGAILGAPPDMGELASSDVRYRGAAECAVPGRGRSVHIVLEAPSGELVSLFVQQDHDELELEPGVAYWFLGDGVPHACRVLTWRRDGLVYFLVSPSTNDIDAARVALRANAPSGVL